jgi:hypothetical protein
MGLQSGIQLGQASVATREAKRDLRALKLALSSVTIFAIGHYNQQQEAVGWTLDLCSGLTSLATHCAQVTSMS